MTSRKIVAVFDTAEAAQKARRSLSELGLRDDRISITDQSSTLRNTHTSGARGSFWAHIKEMFMPEEDRHAYEEGLRRGGCMLVASVDDAQADDAIARLEAAGAVDLNEREGRWRSEGWQPAASTEASAATRDTAVNTSDEAGSRGAATNVGDEESERIPLAAEQLRIGKREVNRGSVRVRSYIVEDPVHEEVRLRDERVQVERRPVDEPTRPVVRGSPEDLLQERTIEVTETGEEAVIGKEARVTEEVVVRKNAGERVEEIDDTVRRTEVEIEDGRSGQTAGRQSSPRTAPPATRRN